MKLGIIANVAILFLVCFFSSCNNKKEEYASGTFEATEITVSAEAMGKILNFDEEEGDIISKGECIGLIDTVQLSLRRLQLLANRNSIISQRPDINKQVAALHEQIKKAEIEKNRVVNLIKAGAGNQKQLDDYNSQLEILNKQLQAKLSSLYSTDNSLNEQSSSVDIQIAQIDDQLSKSKILSPISGTILAKYMEEGELATVGKPIFKIADMQKVYLKAYITANQLKDVAVGKNAIIISDFGEYNGKVTWISQEAEFTPKNILTEDEMANQVYAVKISFKNDGKVKLGMYGKVKFI